MPHEHPLVSQDYLLEKFPGKGGWTYAAIPEIAPDPHAHFGCVHVRGSIDALPIPNAHLMPLGDGRLFLPVRLAIRKKIRKEAGDWVRIVLFLNETPLEIPEELRQCLEDVPEAYEAFQRCTDREKKAYLDWIYSAKHEDTRVARIVQLIDQLTPAW
ncbi:protein of unknown function [Catalinimonas alkaloidigena]|uniref:Bacteriocin-protection, YdeI or OmpD-Associated n=1 Tax=Catalinimonas alkaloidigena TaxID=1075417 RepID=A0A1G9H9G6_9BACT|nr:YdeI/OmpD-associated family protein [Catalinimonas alkaloidigena]SDL09414.1 protein of unknown function [Catalinimonas alkaloidigena]